MRPPCFRVRRLLAFSQFSQPLQNFGGICHLEVTEFLRLRDQGFHKLRQRSLVKRDIRRGISLGPQIPYRSQLESWLRSAARVQIVGDQEPAIEVLVQRLTERKGDRFRIEARTVVALEHRHEPVHHPVGDISSERSAWRASSRLFSCALSQSRPGPPIAEAWGPNAIPRRTRPTAGASLSRSNSLVVNFVPAFDRGLLRTVAQRRLTSKHQG